MKQLIMIVSFCLLVIPGSDMLICKLNAPSGAANGVWPGSVIVLNCTILQDGPVEYITWKKDGYVLRNTSLVSPGKSLLMWEGLKLEDVSDKDEGQYSCLAVKGIHSREDWYTLNLYAKPYIITPRLAEVELRTGDIYSVTCSAIGWPKPNITWTKDGNKYMKSSHVLKTSFGLTLRFLFARVIDTGTYACHANNSIGSDFEPVIVKVNKMRIRMRRVKVTTPYHKITVYENQNISLECQASDIVKKYTAPIWKHNGKLPEGNQTFLKFDGANHVVFWYRINNVTLKDAGSYSCGVHTHEGGDSQVIRLNVERRGPPRVSSKNQTIFSKLGSSVNLSCTLIYADSADVTMEWTQNHNQRFYADPGHYNSQQKDIRDGSIIYSLVIRNVTVKYFGCYNCYFNTSLGSDSSSVCLKLRLKQAKKEFLTIYASSSADPLWKTTVPVFLVCLVVCVAGFIAGFYARRNKLRRSGFQDTSDPRSPDGYQYDVFITFSNKDFHWVKTELIPLIEKHNLNYCIHNRDFQPGKTIVDNMADSVYNSRRILAVLSKNYMSSTFCRGELDMALCRNTLLKDSSLIAIRVDEIEKKRLPKALQGKTFLDYHEDQEKNLWEIRLAKQLALNEEEENSL